MYALFVCTCPLSESRARLLRQAAETEGACEAPAAPGVRTGRRTGREDRDGCFHSWRSTRHSRPHPAASARASMHRTAGLRVRLRPRPRARVTHQTSPLRSAADPAEKLHEVPSAAHLPRKKVATSVCFSYSNQGTHVRDPDPAAVGHGSRLDQLPSGALSAGLLRRCYSGRLLAMVLCP